MALSKREYREAQIPKEDQARYAEAFNRVRPQSAWIDHDHDGQDVLLVRGWLDPQAAALVSLVRSAYPLSMINEQAIEQRVRTLAAAGPGEALGPELVGTPRDPGEGTPIDPLAPPPREASLMDVSDLPQPVTPTRENAPGPATGPIQPLQGRSPSLEPASADARVQGLVAGLARILGMSEEQALLWAITEAVKGER